MSVKAWNIHWDEMRWVSDSPAVRRQPAPGEGRSSTLRANLSGFNQVPPVLSSGSGNFQARISANEDRIEYRLSYDNLSAPAAVAHIHFGHPTDNGGVFTFLCGGGGKPACPGVGGTVTGTITADDILALPDQGVPAGDLEGALRIIRAGLGYVNVHNANFPDGEIRGQIRA